MQSELKQLDITWANGDHDAREGTPSAAIARWFLTHNGEGYLLLKQRANLVHIQGDTHYYHEEAPDAD